MLSSYSVATSLGQIALCTIEDQNGVFVMQIPEPIETYGYFWLPENTDQKFMGVLKIYESGESELELYGTFHDRRQDWPRMHILGVVDKGGPVTLTDCMYLNVSRNLGRTTDILAKSKIAVRCVFLRSHLESEVNLQSLEFSVEGLKEWFFFVNAPISTGPEYEGIMSILYRRPAPIEVPIDESLKLTFLMNPTQSTGLFEGSIRVNASVFLESNHPRSFQEFMTISSKIRDFLSLALGRVVSFTSIRGFLAQLANSSGFPNVVEVYGKFDPYALTKQDINIGNILFGYNEIAENISPLLRQWLDSYERFEPTFNLYFTVSANRFMHLEGKFLFLVQGLESLHRRSSQDTHMDPAEFEELMAAILEHVPAGRKDWIQNRFRYANELSLRRRLRDLTAPFAHLFGTPRQCNSFIDKIVNTRNFLTHYDTNIDRQAATESDQLLDDYLKLETLLKLHLLRLVGIGAPVIDRIAANSLPLQSDSRSN